MHRAASNSSRGFTLVELLVAVALGVMVMSAAVSLFKKGSDVTTVTSQRSQLQTDLRAAEAMLVRDISMAGAGMPSGGIPVPTTAPLPRYGCDITAVCYVVANFPSFATAPVTPNTAYYVLPGPAKGPVITVGQPATDTITVIYADNAFLLNDYTVTFNATGTAATFAPPVPLPAPPPQDVNDPVVGLRRGDVVMFQNTKGTALAVVTGDVTVAGLNFTAPFANGDVLNLNNSAVGSRSIPSILAGTKTQASRIWIITYYLDTTVDAGGNVTARLMRQVNTQPPVPLADNIVNLKFTYDAYDNLGVLQAELPDAGAGNVPPVTPNMIQKVNLAALTGRSSFRGTQGFQGLSLQTQISVRNLSFKDRYQ
jgi:prepilin-type N-terminal cleavage/methylation domain-containing protein